QLRRAGAAPNRILVSGRPHVGLGQSNRLPAEVALINRTCGYPSSPIGGLEVFTPGPGVPFPKLVSWNGEPGQITLIEKRPSTRTDGSRQSPCSARSITISALHSPAPRRPQAHPGTFGDRQP